MNTYRKANIIKTKYGIKQLNIVFLKSISATMPIIMEPIKVNTTLSINQSLPPKDGRLSKLFT